MRGNGAIFKSGMALATALVISFFLLIIGLAFLTFTWSDYYTAGKEQSDAQAFYLAKAGMTYFASNGFPSGSTTSGNTETGTLDVPQGDAHHYCVITQNLTTKDLTFTGTVSDYLGRTIALRQIIAPGGNLSSWYEATR